MHPAMLLLLVLLLIGCAPNAETDPVTDERVMAKGARTEAEAARYCAAHGGGSAVKLEQPDANGDIYQCI